MVNQRLSFLFFGDWEDYKKNPQRTFHRWGFFFFIFSVQSPVVVFLRLDFDSHLLSATVIGSGSAVWFRGCSRLKPFFVFLWINLWTNLWITNVVFSTLTRHNGYMEVTVIDCEETCKCGITYQTWLVYDMECIDDKIHVWEE